jgi:hypothetical protein
MLIVALPLLSFVAAELKLPLVSVTAPVGVGVPPTVTETESAWSVVMLDEAGITVTVGVVPVTVTGVDMPTALL